MTNDNEKTTPATMEEQLKELLRKANVSFIANQGMTRPAAQQGDQKDQPREPSQDRLQPLREFEHKPRDVRDYLDRFVIGQAEAKKVLSVAICDHYNHIRRCIEDEAHREKEYAKHNIVLLGPTGVGKTYLMRCIARLIGVPFVKADATKFTETYG